MSVFRKTQYGGREVRPGGKEASPRGVGDGGAAEVQSHTGPESVQVMQSGMSPQRKSEGLED